MMVANSSEMPKGVEHNVKLILKVDEISPLAGEHVRRMLILNDDCLAGKISVAVRTASIEREIRVLKNALLEEELRRIVAAFVEDLDTEAHAGAPSHEAGSEAIMDLPFDSIKEITDGENGQESKADDASMPMMFSSGGQETLTIKAEGLWRNPPPAFSLDMRGGGAKR